MKKYAYYHMYLTDDAAAWSSFLLENFKRMEDHGLLDELEKVYLVVVGKPNNVGLAAGLAKTLSNKYEIIAYQDTFNSDSDLSCLDDDKSEKAKNQVNENVTVKLLYDHARREDAYFLYNHSKGISSFERILKTGDFNRFINYYYWKEYLSWAVIDKWKDCLVALSHYDVSGTNYFSTPEKHYSGNFWWSKSSHLITLPDPATNEWWFDMQRDHWDHHLRNSSVRFKDEMWVCSNKDTKIFNLRDIEHMVGSRLYERRATKKLYV